ncbi:MAG TPA: MqnA/MqnD/SBP family protein [Bacteroidota bacterium]|nr:MqnA/MqnD/SBP family protein [Bacteroidota bacterium]
MSSDVAQGKPFLAFPEALYLKPLLEGLEGSESPFRHLVDIPASIALNMSKSTATPLGKRIPMEGQGCAFLSPIDYARYGAEYCIVPGIAVSSSRPTGSVELYVKSDIRNIATLAVDVRVTSEIILAKIILTEKYPNVDKQASFQIIPMIPDLDAMLAKADAALVVNFAPSKRERGAIFHLDLVEEWNDLTELPYVHGFWVGRQNEMYVDDLQRLMQAQTAGTSSLRTVAERHARAFQLSVDEAERYLSSFSYQLGQEQIDSLQEFMSYAFYYGVLPDIPEINFFDVEGTPAHLRN